MDQRGKGTEVTLYVLRDGKEETLTATRDTIEAQTVEYEMKDGGIGYIRVSEFDLVTYDQFKAVLDDLEDQGMAGLVIDLRNNPGGNLDVVCNMLKLLLPEGTIVSTKEKMVRRMRSRAMVRMNSKSRWQFL